MERSEALAGRLDVAVREVAVRPARADERRRWDALMAEHHYLGFRQFAGRGHARVGEQPLVGRVALQSLSCHGGHCAPATDRRETDKC